jgi:hypothetical protein
MSVPVGATPLTDGEPASQIAALQTAVGRIRGE